MCIKFDDNFKKISFYKFSSQNICTKNHASNLMNFQNKMIHLFFRKKKRSEGKLFISENKYNDPNILTLYLCNNNLALTKLELLYIFKSNLYLYEVA